eukprot:NODE_107_length_19843_cov_0.502077.p3 type:complete len:540 gc:universal NODE_107_length_19843_cov_0.502077:13343-11724(-)
MFYLLILLAFSKGKSPPYVRPSDSLVIELNPKTYNTYVKTGNNLVVVYYAHWCHYSKKMLPFIDLLSKKAKDLPIKIVSYDCELSGQEKLCDDLKIDGYPTIYSYHGTNKVKEYERNENLDRLYEFVTEFLSSVEKLAKEDTRGYNFVSRYFKKSHVVSNPKGEVVDLEDSNFDSIVKNEPWFIEFYADWCGHCKALKPVWDQLGKSLQNKVNIGKIEASINKITGSKYDVQGYPTLLFINGEKSEKYRGDRSLDSLKRFALLTLSKSYISEFRQKDLREVQQNQAVGIIIYSNNVDNNLKTYMEASAELKFDAPVYTMSLHNAKYFLPIFSPKLGTQTAMHLKSTENYVMYYYPNAQQDNQLLFYFASTASGIHLKNWFKKNKYPFMAEINGDNSESLLSDPDMTVLGIGQTANDFEELAIKFKNMVPPHVYDADISRSVQFALFNQKQHTEWFKNMFGISTGIVLLNTKNNKFYKVDPDGDAIKLTTVIPALSALVTNSDLKDILGNTPQPSSWKSKEWPSESFGNNGVLSVILELT